MARFAALFIAAAFMPAATITAAQAQGVSGTAFVAAQLRPGAPVFNATGRNLGTIESVSRDSAVLMSRSGPVTISKLAFGPSSKGLFVDLTDARLAVLARNEAARNTNPPG